MTPRKLKPQRAGRKEKYPGEPLFHVSVTLTARQIEKATAAGDNLSDGLQVMIDNYPLPVTDPLPTTLTPPATRIVARVTGGEEEAKP